MKRFNLRTLRLCGALCLITGLARAEIPRTITYQGFLRDTLNQPVADGPYQMKFIIWDAAVGGSNLWSSAFQTINTVTGQFAYNLGSNVNLPDLLFKSDTTRYLGITVGIEPEMSPRIKLAAQPYSYQALKADSADAALTAENAANLGGLPPAFYSDWNNLVNVPAGFADNTDDNTTYSAGSGLQLTGTVLSIPPDGVSSAQIQDEPGVAQDLMPVVTPLTGPVEVVVSRDLTAPTSGYVLALASFSIQVTHLTGTTTSVVFGVSTSSTTFPPDQLNFWTVASSEPTGIRNDIISVSRMFSVNAGATTFYLLGQKASGAANPDVFSKTLSLVFFPTAYGTFDN